MADDFDVYGDLDCIESEIKKDDQELNDLQQKINTLQEKIDATVHEKELVERKNEILLENISSLLLTAKAELKRKDNIIGDLRQQVENSALRRGGHSAGAVKRATKYTQTTCTSQLDVGTQTRDTKNVALCKEYEDSHRDRDRNSDRDRRRDQVREYSRSRGRTSEMERRRSRDRDRHQSRERSQHRDRDRHQSRERSQHRDRKREQYVEREGTRDKRYDRERHNESGGHRRGYSQERNRSRDRSANRHVPQRVSKRASQEERNRVSSVAKDKSSDKKLKPHHMDKTSGSIYDAQLPTEKYPDFCTVLIESDSNVYIFPAPDDQNDEDALSGSTVFGKQSSKTSTSVNPPEESAKMVDCERSCVDNETRTGTNVPSSNSNERTKPVGRVSDSSRDVDELASHPIKMDKVEKSDSKRPSDQYEGAKASETAMCTEASTTVQNTSNTDRKHEEISHEKRIGIVGNRTATNETSSAPVVTQDEIMGKQCSKDSAETPIHQLLQDLSHTDGKKLAEESREGTETEAAVRAITEPNRSSQSEGDKDKTQATNALRNENSLPIPNNSTSSGCTVENIKGGVANPIPEKEKDCSPTATGNALAASNGKTEKAKSRDKQTNTKNADKVRPSKTKQARTDVEKTNEKRKQKTSGIANKTETVAEGSINNCNPSVSETIHPQRTLELSTFNVENIPDQACNSNHGPQMLSEKLPAKSSKNLNNDTTLEHAGKGRTDKSGKLLNATKITETPKAKVEKRELIQIDPVNMQDSFSILTHNDTANQEQFSSLQVDCGTTDAEKERHTDTDKVTNPEPEMNLNGFLNTSAIGLKTNHDSGSEVKKKLVPPCDGTNGNVLKSPEISSLKKFFMNFNVEDDAEEMSVPPPKDGLMSGTVIQKISTEGTVKIVRETLSKENGGSVATEPQSKASAPSTGCRKRKMATDGGGTTPKKRKSEDSGRIGSTSTLPVVSPFERYPRRSPRLKGLAGTETTITPMVVIHSPAKAVMQLSFETPYKIPSIPNTPGRIERSLQNVLDSLCLTPVKDQNQGSSVKKKTGVTDSNFKSPPATNPCLPKRDVLFESLFRRNNALQSSTPLCTKTPSSSDRSKSLAPPKTGKKILPSDAACKSVGDSPAIAALSTVKSGATNVTENQAKKAQKKPLSVAQQHSSGVKGVGGSKKRAQPASKEGVEGEVGNCETTVQVGKEKNKKPTKIKPPSGKVPFDSVHSVLCKGIPCQQTNTKTSESTVEPINHPLTDEISRNLLNAPDQVGHDQVASRLNVSVASESANITGESVFEKGTTVNSRVVCPALQPERRHHQPGKQPELDIMTSGQTTAQENSVPPVSADNRSVAEGSKSVGPNEAAVDQSSRELMNVSKTKVTSQKISTSTVNLNLSLADPGSIERLHKSYPSAVTSVRYVRELKIVKEGPSMMRVYVSRK